MKKRAILVGLITLLCLFTSVYATPELFTFYKGRILGAHVYELAAKELIGDGGAWENHPLWGTVIFDQCGFEWKCSDGDTVHRGGVMYSQAEKKEGVCEVYAEGNYRQECRYTTNGVYMAYGRFFCERISGNVKWTGAWDTEQIWVYDQNGCDTLGATRCDTTGKNIEKCIDYQWTLFEACPSGCSSGACVECKNGDFRCSSDKKKVEKCVNNKWGYYESCEYKCENGDCVTPVCSVLGEKKCFGNVLKTCSNYDWVTVSTCQYGCSNGACNPKPDCLNDGDKTCDGDDIKICSNGKWVFYQHCNNGCSDGTCISCTNNEKRCNGNTLEVCSNGNWVYYQSCQYGCSDGACINTPPCTSGNTQCSGNDVEICVNGKWTYAETCEYGCVNGICNQQPNPCTVEGEKRCSGNNLETCMNSMWMTTEVCQYGCESGKCNPEPNPCVKDENCEEGYKCVDSICVKKEWWEENLGLIGVAVLVAIATALWFLSKTRRGYIPGRGYSYTRRPIYPSQMKSQQRYDEYQ